MEVGIIKRYFGAKIIEAEPMFDPEAPCSPGDMYRVRYEDGYESKSPRDVFEKYYHEASYEVVGGGYSLDKKMANAFIKKIDIGEVDEIGAVHVKSTLLNNLNIMHVFTVNEPDVSRVAIVEACKDMVRKDVQSMLEFVYCWGYHGLNNTDKENEK